MDHQQLRAGLLMSSAVHTGGITPMAVVEEVAEGLLDNLLDEMAAGAGEGLHLGCESRPKGPGAGSIK